MGSTVTTAPEVQLFARANMGKSCRAGQPELARRPVQDSACHKTMVRAKMSSITKLQEFGPSTLFCMAFLLAVSVETRQNQRDKMTKYKNASGE